MKYTVAGLKLRSLANAEIEYAGTITGGYGDSLLDSLIEAALAHTPAIRRMRI